MKLKPNLLRVGVIGVGTMGQHHVRILSETKEIQCSGIFDPDSSRAIKISSRFGCKSYSSLEDLLDNSDAVCVAAPTRAHMEIGLKCFKRGIHVLMEKPLAHNLDGAKRLVEAAQRSGATLMVGHVERYNPAVEQMMRLLASYKEEIVSIDARRLAPFDGSRCMDVDVLYDLLIHDVDLALEIASSSISVLHSVGRSVFSKQIDVAHVIIEFQNGAIASFWTGKCSPKKMRAITVTTPCRYMVADTLERSLTMYTADQIPAPEKEICFMGNITTEQIPVPDKEPLRQELEDFLKAIQEEKPPIVDGNRALAAMKVLELVRESVMKSKSREISSEIQA